MQFPSCFQRYVPYPWMQVMLHPDFDPVCIKNVYDVNIVINRGVEIKEKAPPSIYHFMFQRLKLMLMVFHASQEH